MKIIKKSIILSLSLVMLFSSALVGSSEAFWKPRRHANRPVVRRRIMKRIIWSFFHFMKKHHGEHPATRCR